MFVSKFVERLAEGLESFDICHRLVVLSKNWSRIIIAVLIAAFQLSRL